jgi:hypothetical protein
MGTSVRTPRNSVNAPPTDPASVEPEFSNSALVQLPRFFITEIACRTSPLASNAQRQHGVRSIAGVNRSVHLIADQPLMRGDENGRDAALAQIVHEFVELNGEKSLLRHRAQKPSGCR